MFEYTPISCCAEHVTKDLIADTSDADERVWALYANTISCDTQTGAPIEGEKSRTMLVPGFNCDDRYTLDEAIELYNALDEESVARFLTPGEYIHVVLLTPGEHTVDDIVPIKMLVHVDDTEMVEDVACEYQFETHVHPGTPGIQKADRPSAEQVKESSKLFFQAAAFLQGDGVERDLRRGIELMERSAELGNCLAQYNLYRFYLGPERDKHTQQEALTLLEKAARQNMREALAELGDIYAVGDMGMEVDLHRALTYYIRAVSLGAWNVIPQCVGILLKNCNDPQLAIQLYKLGARKGDPTCQEVMDSFGM